MCTQCKGKHKSNHKIVAYLTPKDIDRLRSDAGEQLAGLKTIDLACPDHRFEFYTKYCFTDNMPICAKCAVTQPVNELDFNKIKEIENQRQEINQKPEDGDPSNLVRGHKGHYSRHLDDVLAQALKEKQ